MGKTINLQDMFLNQVRKEAIPVTVYVDGGVQLKGLVKGFDAFTILIQSDNKPTELIYKHAVSAILPTKQPSAQKPPGRQGDPAHE